MPSDWLDLPAPPALPLLYARAVLRGGVRGDTLPSQGLRCPVSVEPAHLERYRQLCGFAEGSLLPATYPHLLAFSLQLKLLTGPSFPFPLLGLVHLENRIRVVRPLGGLGPFVASVQVQHLRPHEKGQVFSLLTRLEDQLGLLWEGDSLLLRRGPPMEGGPAPHSEEPALPLATLAQWPAPAAIGRRYARLSGDYNPIHLSALSARGFGFPRAIAHGLWNKARLLAALGERLPTAGYSVQARFQKPLLLPGEVSLLASEVADEGHFRLQSDPTTPHISGGWRLI
ncbi:MAG: MaoC/PaaZ C-terminal domain-containing protein [Pseudomonas sp.]|uniref:MaoC family dehydratase n=1 Tax=Pseudomonas sp. TaxID=306 RepID=UPI003399BDD7